MTQPFDEYGDRLRRVLQAEAEAVTPSPDGLERIRTKIDDRRERRFGLGFNAPWLRPLAAVGAAVAFTAVTVTASPALKNFVQTGHFNPARHDGGGEIQGGGRISQSFAPPGVSGRPGATGSPRPSSTPSGKDGHVFVGSCPPGEDTVPPKDDKTPTAGPSSDTRPIPRITITCRPKAPTSSEPDEQPSTPPVTPPPQGPPSDQPTGGDGQQQPSPQSSP